MKVSYAAFHILWLIWQNSCELIPVLIQISNAGRSKSAPFSIKDCRALSHPQGEIFKVAQCSPNSAKGEVTGNFTTKITADNFYKFWAFASIYWIQTPLLTLVEFITCKIKYSIKGSWTALIKYEHSQKLNWQRNAFSFPNKLLFSP